ncbi:hypothetical protein Mp_7g06590 [Marchantia polymorpha subsp. ruderalis]|uniref:Uncharacterized protein n=2 Tax=Marchantia polymorpha TaxID=3197 RepID=A0AAF6BWT8_MARPO|nr:hypothetical protein MARPO_0057s0008 [Marchantia polymorpha]BBN16472.1 hypothetical protein Mp_7g06590 [Marchantia polymorpha subsp. ruderalis]|eukprot:PTQ37365.1 hypothetical protein MARPO_0057s0008 [Marchantia polymorpha]
MHARVADVEGSTVGGSLRVRGGVEMASSARGDRSASQLNPNPTGVAVAVDATEVRIGGSGGGWAGTGAGSGVAMGRGRWPVTARPWRERIIVGPKLRKSSLAGPGEGIDQQKHCLLFMAIRAGFAGMDVKRRRPISA